MLSAVCERSKWRHMHELEADVVKIQRLGGIIEVNRSIHIGYGVEWWATNESWA